MNQNVRKPTTCAPCEDSDQPAQSRNQINIFTVRILNSQGYSFFMRTTNTLIRLHSRSLGAVWIAKDAKFLHADNEDSDQTARMRSLIRVFVRRTFQKVRFLTLRLKYFDDFYSESNAACNEAVLKINVDVVISGQPPAEWEMHSAVSQHMWHSSQNKVYCIMLH